MNKTMLLLKTQIYNYFSLNELFHSEKKKSNFVFITAVGIFTLLAFLSGYNVMTALALAKMGQAQTTTTLRFLKRCFLCAMHGQKRIRQTFAVWCISLSVWQC